MSDYKNNLDTGVNNIGYTIVRIAPIVAPIPALATLLDATNYALYAWFVVFGVELTGYAIGEQLVRAIRLGVLSLKISAIPLTVYGLVIEGLMIGYKVAPAWAGWYAGKVDTSHAIQAGVGILYPFFTLAGAVLFAFHEYLERTQGDEDYEKQSSRRDRETDDELERELKRLRAEAELEAYRLKLSQDAELEREKALTDLRIKEQKAAAKVSETVSKSNVSIVATPEKGFQETDLETIEKAIVRFLKSNPGAKLDNIASHVGTTTGNVSKKITMLVDKEVLHEERQGNRRVVTVNGRHEEYLAGKL